MMKKLIFVIVVIFLFSSCIADPKKKDTKTANVTTKTQQSKKSVLNKNKLKVGSNTYEELVKRTKKYADNLDFNLAYIRKKGLKDKKYLAEFLGLYLKLNKALTSKKDRAAIHKRLTPFYQETLKPAYHNMAKVNDKLFKANSMSYLRIMWLFDQLGFDISYYKKELAKVQKRMDDHLIKRGEWQKAVFDWYYNYFKIKKPLILKNAKKLKGSIGTKQPFDKYNRNQAYVLTHFVFAAYDYGNKTTQNRFNDGDINYLKEILPKLIAKFEQKRNDDIVGELLTCQVLIDDTKTPAFKKSYKRLMNRQNQDGSFGAYEKYRTKIGDDVEFRAYQHTTLVCFETFVEFKDRQSVFN